MLHDVRERKNEGKPSGAPEGFPQTVRKWDGMCYRKNRTRISLPSSELFLHATAGASWAWIKQPGRSYL